MNCAADFRRIAREALSGKWLTAVIAGLIAALLGGVSSDGPELKFSTGDSGTYMTFGIGDFNFYSTGVEIAPETATLLGDMLGYILIALFALALLFLVVGSVVQLGYCRFNLDLIDGYPEPEVKTLFSYFPHWGTAVAASLKQGLLVILWSLLLIVPGIMAAYSYAMTPYILAEHPEMTSGDAILHSKEIMYGNRWRLFCLEFSFIGWSLLSVLTLGIGNLWLIPYRQAAIAAFYREIS